MKKMTNVNLAIVLSLAIHELQYKLEKAERGIDYYEEKERENGVFDTTTESKNFYIEAAKSFRKDIEDLYDIEAQFRSGKEIIFKQRNDKNTGKVEY